METQPYIARGRFVDLPGHGHLWLLAHIREPVDALLEDPQPVGQARHGPGVKLEPTPLPDEGEELPKLPAEGAAKADVQVVDSGATLERLLGPERPIYSRLRIRGIYRAERCGPARAEPRLMAIELEDGGSFRLNPVRQDDVVRPRAEIEAFEGERVELVVAPSVPAGAWELISLCAVN